MLRALVLLSLLLLPRANAAEPVRVVFDTNITGDVDDVLALAMLHTLARSVRVRHRGRHDLEVQSAGYPLCRRNQHVLRSPGHLGRNFCERTAPRQQVFEVERTSFIAL